MNIFCVGTAGGTPTPKEFFEGRPCRTDFRSIVSLAYRLFSKYPEHASKPRIPESVRDRPFQ